VSIRRLFDTPVLVVDALGLANEIKSSDGAGLLRIVERLDRQYRQFRAKVPHRVMFVHRWGVLGSKDFATIRLNDMFVVYSPRRVADPALRYLITSSLLYQTLLRAEVIPRGGLGFGPVVQSKDLVLGAGFIDAYETSEKRADGFRDICAIKISAQFLRRVPPSKKAWKLVCFYKGQFFVHPFRLVDPELGEFDKERILSCLRAAGVNSEKLLATEQFLEGLEDYDAAESPTSKSRRFADAMRSQMTVHTDPATTPNTAETEPYGIELETWNRETVGYRDRIGALHEILNTLGPVFSRIPRAPLDFQPTKVGALKYQLCLLVIGTARSAQELLSSISLLAVTGSFLSASVCTRLLIELVGQLAFADQRVLQRLGSPNELEAATERLKRLLHGSKVSVPERDGIPDVAVINVMEFVRAAEAVVPGMQKSYDFLCDASHPNFTQHGYLLFAGSEYDNWRNPAFAGAAREILDKTVAAAEQAIVGIVECATQIVEKCLPQILAERRRKP